MKLVGMQPDCMIPDLSNEDYHASHCPGYSRTQLVNLCRSIEHMKVKKEKTPALILGNLVHDFILMGDQFVSNNYAIEVKFSKKKDDQEKKKEWIDSMTGVTIVDQKMYDSALKMRDAVFNHPTAIQLLEGSLNEQSFFWKDELSGEICRCRPDARREDLSLLIDIKTTQDASFNSFRKSVATYLYDMQAAFYLDGVSKVLQVPYRNFLFIAVESKEPYGVACYHINEAAIEVGRQLYRRALGKIKEYQEEARTGYSELIQTIDLPAWAFDIEARI